MAACILALCAACVVCAAATYLHTDDLGGRFERSLEVSALGSDSSIGEERQFVISEKRPPQFEKQHYDAAIPENQRRDSGIIEVKAKSFSDREIRYIIRAQGRGAGTFSIDPTTGIVKLAKDLDYDNPTQLKTYWLIVTATEDLGGLSSNVELIINVTDVNDNAPRFELPDYQVHNVDEDVAAGTSILKVSASDLDQGKNAEIEYSLDKENFRIDNNGIIYANRRLESNTYVFMVWATDKGDPPLTGTSTVHIHTRKKNDEPPNFNQDVYTSKCEYKELPCESGECVDRTSWCDGPPDCFDDSDEKYCRTFDPNESKRPSNINDCNESRYFQCQNGMCIPKVARCNDMPDCQDGEDEEHCDYMYESNDPDKEDTDSTTAMSLIRNLSTTSKPFVVTVTEAPSSTVPSKNIPRGDTSWIPSRFDILQKSIRHLLEQRDALWGWGKSTPRMVTTLYLSNASYFEKDNFDGLLTKKQLEVQLALDLMKYNEKPLRMHDLVHYVQALIATCVNPRDFHGVNIVKLLKKSIGRRQTRGLFVSPLAYLALCNAGDAADPHLRRLKKLAYRRNDEPRWLDVQTYALLAISCFSLQNSSQAREWRAMRGDVARNVSEWQQLDGGFGSVHSTGLALQALIAADEPGTETAKSRAMTHLLMNREWQGMFDNELNSYYVLPALNIKSLASIHQKRCRIHAHDTQGTEGERYSAESSKHTIVHYSLWIGGEKNEMQTITLAVPRHSNFIDITEAAQKLNPHFKHEFLSVGKKTTVHAIAGRPSDIEKGIYWTLYRKVPVPFRPKLSNTTVTEARLKLLGAMRWTKDLRQLHPRNGENLVFWYKPYL